MNINGTIINYYFHCKRQCYLFANRLNMEDCSEDVRVGRVLHEIKAQEGKNTEIKYDNMAIDKLTEKYVEEIKKSDADINATRMQVLFYLKNLAEKGVYKEGKLKVIEKNKKEKINSIVLDDKTALELEECLKNIEKLLSQTGPPKAIYRKTCEKCAYYEYCYI